MAEMNPNYWRDVDPPTSFIPEGWTYEQKRAFRYQHLDYWHEWAQPERFKGKRILCVGEGSGIDAIEFARNGAHVTAIDTSAKTVALIHRHFVEARPPGGDVHGVDAASACALPYKNESFDAVYCFGVLHHIPEVEKAVSEIVRVLKPGGLFLGMVYNRNSLLYAYSILARAEREGITADEAMRLYSERNPGCPHSVAYTSAELAVLLREFAPLTISPVYDVIDLPGQRKAPFRVGQFAESAIIVPTGLGWHLLFEATK
jgi:SAM-dependent methyltransferase